MSEEAKAKGVIYGGAFAVAALFAALFVCAVTKKTPKCPEESE